MVVDLYKSLLTKERKYFTIIDGIMAGEGQGPFCPTSKHANVLIGGFDFLLTDIVAARYMGLNPEKIKYLEYFIKEWGIKLSDLPVFFNGEFKVDFYDAPTRYADFEVPFAWRGIKY
jgi:uncharacterized protein (DUF362 family)